MKAGLSTIQQTLTPEASTVLNNSIAEAGRRNHGQTTPLHVAATLLAAPSGFLRQACIRSHPNSSHPLQCRALELCFSVALERLPTSQNSSPGLEPPISNALLAALKRAQAHQRRGCPEQQQQPLLAVKVELEQLIISILDDPSVSRVMREASFSSPAVKSTIEQSLNSQTNTNQSNPSIGMGFRPPHMAAAPSPNRNLYLNPRLQQQSNLATQSGTGPHRNEDSKKIIDIFLRSKKRNPVLVGDSEPGELVKEVLKKIENREIEDGTLKNTEVIHLQNDLALSLDKTQLPTKFKDLEKIIGSRTANSNNCSGLILYLGDLKWLVEQPLPVSGGGVPPQQVVSDAGRVAVAEMSKLLAKFGGLLRIIGTATCETYLRCQVYHPTMENDWDLQAVPIAAKTPLPGMFSRLGTNVNLTGPATSLSQLKSFGAPAPLLPRRLLETSDNSDKTSCCPQCTKSYEQELAKLVGKEEAEKSSPEAKSEASRSALPPWLQNAKAHNNEIKTTDPTQNKDQELIVKHQTQELQKKWNNTCLNLHPTFHKSIVSDRITPTSLSMTGSFNPNLLQRQSFEPKLQLTRNLGESLKVNPNLGDPLKVNPIFGDALKVKRNLGDSLKVNPNLGISLKVNPTLAPPQSNSPPRSPVRTDLALGQTKNTVENTHEARLQDFMGCISSDPQNNSDLQNIKLMTNLEADFADSFKRLLKGLSDKVWWQQDAASAVAASVTQCKLGNGKKRGSVSKKDVWLLFVGPDRVGKRKMASILSEHISGSHPITISLGSRRSYEPSDSNIRGKTVLDRIAEAVRRNPFSVIMLEDIDEADMLIRGNIKRAMDRGRIADSHGREISLGNVIFILTENGVPENSNILSKTASFDEEKLANLAAGGWQLRLVMRGGSKKRQGSWLNDENTLTKHRKENPGFSFDLNESADEICNKFDNSRNSSDLTVDHEENHHSLMKTPRELINLIDETIVFKPVDPGPVRIKFSSYISTTFSTIIDDKLSIEVQHECLEKILGGVWLGRIGLEEWTEKYLVPTFRQLKMRIPSVNFIGSDETLVVRLELDEESGSRSLGDWLPSKINLVVNE